MLPPHVNPFNQYFPHLLGLQRGFLGHAQHQLLRLKNDQRDMRRDMRRDMSKCGECGECGGCGASRFGVWKLCLGIHLYSKILARTSVHRYTSVASYAPIQRQNAYDLLNSHGHSHGHSPDTTAVAQACHPNGCPRPIFQQIFRMSEAPISSVPHVQQAAPGVTRSRWSILTHLLCSCHYSISQAESLSRKRDPSEWTSDPSQEMKWLVSLSLWTVCSILISIVHSYFIFNPSRIF